MCCCPNVAARGGFVTDIESTVLTTHHPHGVSPERVSLLEFQETTMITHIPSTRSDRSGAHLRRYEDIRDLLPDVDNQFFGFERGVAKYAVRTALLFSPTPPISKVPPKGSNPPCELSLRKRQTSAATGHDSFWQVIRVQSD